MGHFCTMLLFEVIIKSFHTLIKLSTYLSSTSTSIWFHPHLPTHPLMTMALVGEGLQRVNKAWQSKTAISVDGVKVIRLFELAKKNGKLLRGVDESETKLLLGFPMQRYATRLVIFHSILQAYVHPSRLKSYMIKSRLFHPLLAIHVFV